MGRKALKRKLGKRVLSGKMTVDEARTRLGRQMVQKSAGSAWSTWPEQPRFVPQLQDEEYVRSAVRAPLPRPAPPAVTKSRKQAGAAARAGEAFAARKVAEARAMAGSDGPAFRPPPAGMVVKQLSRTEQAMVTELKHELRIAGHDPARREQTIAEITRIDPFRQTGAV